MASKQDEQENGVSGERLIRPAQALRRAAGGGARSVPRPATARSATPPLPSGPASGPASERPASTRPMSEPGAAFDVARPAAPGGPAGGGRGVEAEGGPAGGGRGVEAEGGPAGGGRGVGAEGRPTERSAFDESATLTSEGAEGPPSAAELLHAGSTLKHYEIVRALGRGGMGTVFLARDTKLGRLVAIKVLLRHSAENAARFLAEARATARCEHENIVVIHEVDELGGCPYMVLEYLEGRTLRDWLDRRDEGGPFGARGGAGERVPPGLAVELVLPVVRALARAHASGIVHRDLKPANIFLTDAGPVKVLDFGIAKRLGAGELSALASPGEPTSVRGELTQPGTLLGTLPYMAPEQWRNEDVDPRSDLWAVGVLLFRLVAGAHPLAPITSVLQLAQIGVLEVPMPGVLGACPDVGALGPIVDRCLRKARGERFASADELLAALEALLPGRAAPALGDDGSPFAGLSSFQEADAGHFFGREREASAVLGRLRSQALVALAGPSGAGKSSLARAGVIPALKRSHDRHEAFVLRPGRRPLAALAEVLAQAGAGLSLGEGAWPEEVPGALDADRLAAVLRTQPGFLGARLRERCRRGGGRALLFVDQFEELYTLGADAAERAAFVACLLSAADDASSPLRVLLSLRSDFLDHAAEDAHFAAELTRGLVLLPPVGREGLREALVRPVEAAGYRFEGDDMPRAMLDALEGARSPLPLLQFAAAKLWEGRDRGRRLLTRESYERVGGVAGALSAHADATVAALSPLERALCRSVLLRLVTPERTRAVVGLDELRGPGEGGGTVEQVVRRLADARLVLIEPGGPEGTVVELVHESLVERWPRLRQWLDESAHDAQFLARLRAAARQWHESGEAEGLLWRERAADEARAWLGRRAEAPGGAGAALGGREERYLRAVVALSERARRLRRRVAASVIVALGAIAFVVSVLALRAQREAVRANSEAAHARSEAARADREAALARNATRLAAARELSPADPTAALSLLREVEPPGVSREWAELAFQALHGGVSGGVFFHPDVVRAAAFSPDGRRFVTTAGDKLVRVFSADGAGAPVVLRGHEGGLISAAFSPDGQRVVSTARDKTARVWDADGKGEPVVLRGHGDGVFGAAFSPDGKRVVTASLDGLARVWNADGTGEPLVLRGHADGLYSAAFSPDGKRVVTASKDGTARVWNTDGTGKPRVLRGHADVVYSAAFSPDGKRIVTASGDRTARVWPAEGPGKPLVLRGHDNAVYSAAFGPDGKRVVTASWDKTVRVWGADGAGEPLVLRGHDDMVYTATFSPDGARILSASNDKTARVWGADGAGKPFDLRGHEGEVYGAAFSPDGRRVVTASSDRTARVWNADGTGRPLVLRGHGAEVTKAAFSPDGARVATASKDKTARVWNADGSGKPLVLRGHEHTVRAASFSPDGARVVTASEDKTARIWPADGKGAPVVLRGHENSLTWAAFSPDGRRVATASVDRTARIWGADGAGEPVVLRGHDGMVEQISFSPDGKRVVTASKDKTARVWNADGTGEPLVLRGHEASVFSAGFSPDGKRVVTGSLDKTVRVWNADGAGEPLVLRGHEGMVSQASFSPDGARVVSGSIDKLARVWRDLTPLQGPADPKLWAATSYCLPAERRVELLQASEAAARADQQACERRVDQARRAAPP